MDPLLLLLKRNVSLSQCLPLMDPILLLLSILIQLLVLNLRQLPLSKMNSWLFLEFPNINPTVLTTIFTLSIRNTRLIFKLVKPSPNTSRKALGLESDHPPPSLSKYFFQSSCGFPITSQYFQKSPIIL